MYSRNPGGVLPFHPITPGVERSLQRRRGSDPSFSNLLGLGLGLGLGLELGLGLGAGLRLRLRQASRLG